MPDKDRTSQAPEELIHPIYLDVPMMVSFFAAIEGGISYSGEFTERIRSSLARDREGQGKAGLPAIASLFGLSLDMSGRFKRQTEDEESTEMKVIREHTEASLFNLLRESLRNQDTFVEINDPSHLAEINAGQLVEISGEILGNPLQQILDAIWQILPYLGIDPEAELNRTGSSRGGHRGGQAKRSHTTAQQASSEDDAFTLADLRLLRTMRDDVGNAKVRDLILQAGGGVRAVLTMAREFLTEEAEEYLLGGRFVALGKVTRVLEEGETINLTRRTAIGLARPEIARDLISSINAEDSDIKVTVGDPIIEAPALQILPLALFV
jgi:hypothetical protein